MDNILCICNHPKKVHCALIDMMKYIPNGYCKECGIGNKVHPYQMNNLDYLRMKYEEKQCL